MSYTLGYKTDSNLISSITLPTTTFTPSISYTYDKLDRVTKKETSLSGTTKISENYTYWTNGYDTSSLITSETLDAFTDITYNYTYDNIGNILTIREGTTLKVSYEYDTLNRLTRENNVYSGKNCMYFYDRAGNIDRRDEYSYTTEYYAEFVNNPHTTVNYSYDDATWGDLLTQYGSTAITYDLSGNPNTWRGATGLTWEGRKLTQFNLNATDNVTYQYNADGIRTRKVYNYNSASQTVYHNYYVDGPLIVGEQTVAIAMGGGGTFYNYYHYDDSGSITGFEYNGTPYYFLKNIQGDVVKICNSAGTVVVEYKYDAWGNVLSITGTLAASVGNANPFRYRGYYFDTETGLYYLNSRYYDPQVGRFLNADGALTVYRQHMDKNKFQKYVAILLCVVGAYMLIFGA